MPSKIFLTQFKEKQIIKTYKSGCTMEETAFKHHLSTGVVRKLLLRNDIPVNKYSRKQDQENGLLNKRYSPEQIQTMPLKESIPYRLQMMIRAREIDYRFLTEDLAYLRNAQEVLKFVLKRTVLFQLDVAIIPFTRFIKGAEWIYDMITPPVNLSLGTVRAAVDRLIKEEFFFLYKFEMSNYPQANLFILNTPKGNQLYRDLQAGKKTINDVYFLMSKSLKEEWDWDTYLLSFPGLEIKGELFAEKH